MVACVTTAHAVASRAQANHKLRPAALCAGSWCTKWCNCRGLAALPGTTLSPSSRLVSKGSMRERQRRLQGTKLSGASDGCMAAVAPRATLHRMWSMRAHSRECLLIVLC
mmetsp:Transcript_8356/g.14036  ORF Transcript_8356/g.14036 Transcript_8356/m.14036 type:complete len:110 (+) Transcript_8356:1691-2020(+)